MGKGAAWERKLANELDDAGWAVMRSGGSGGGTGNDRPDVIAGDGAHGWVIEAKYSTARNIYLEPHEVDQITTLAAGWNMEPVVALRWNTNKTNGAEVADWFPVSPAVAGRTSSGNYSFNVETIQQRYEPLEYYLETDTGDMG